jgi:hypothetical protein
MTRQRNCEILYNYLLPTDDVDYYDRTDFAALHQDALVEHEIQRTAEREAERDVIRRKKNAAHAAVQTAIRDGRLVSGPCEVCDTTENICAHHDDYEKPLDVRWLCREHHADLHGWTPEDSALSAVWRAINKLTDAGDDFRRPSEELADLYRQVHRLRRMKLHHRGMFWVPYSSKTERQLKNEGAKTFVYCTAGGMTIDYWGLKANEGEPS